MKLFRRANEDVRQSAEKRRSREKKKILEKVDENKTRLYRY